MENENSELESGVIKLILKHAAFPANYSGPNTLIQSALGIDGDDGYALMHDFSNEFDVDISNFDDRYFWSENWFTYSSALLPLTPLVWGWMWLTSKGRKVDLTVGDLLKAASLKTWQHPNRDARFPWQRSKSLKM